MEKQGVVSVWIGKGSDRETFNRLLEYSILDDQDGGFSACAFCHYLGIDSYDPDYFGGKYFPKEFTRPKILFHGTELVPLIESNHSELPPSNCYILLYNVAYNGAQEFFDLDGFSFQFIGCFDCE